MDLNFVSDPNLAPKPRGEIRIESLIGTVLPDGNRISVDLRITPFLPTDRPNLAIELRNANGILLTSTHIIETVRDQIRITLHLPAELDENTLTLQTYLYYAEEELQASAATNIFLNK
jgi:hypothetical protein